MSGLMIFGLLALSLSGLAYLATTDPKRRRTFNQPKLTRRRLLWPARLATFAPGVILVAAGHWSGLAIWAGAVTTLGWVMAAIRPQSYAQVNRALQETSRRSWERMVVKARELGDMPARYVPERLRSWPRNLHRLGRTSSAMPSLSDIAELQARVATLEARLRQLEGEDDTLVLTSEDAVNSASTEEKPHMPKPLKAAE